MRMRCLLIAPTNLDVEVLSGVLGELGAEVLFASELGAGVTLAQAPIDRADCAVAVLSSQSRHTAEGLAGIFVDIGVVAGQKIPLVVIVDPNDAPPPALAGATIVRASADHVASLRLHLRMFMLSIASGDTMKRLHRTDALDSASLSEFRDRWDTLRSSLQDCNTYPRDFGVQFQRLVTDILSTAGAIVVENYDDLEADAVASYMPGTETILGPVIIELKPKLTKRGLESAQQRLMYSMRAARAGFCLLVHGGEPSTEFQIPTFMLVLSIDELLTELDQMTIGQLLVRARNRAVHKV